jgi:hypothetical protein
MSKTVKILLWAPNKTEVALVDGKAFLETTIEPKDEIVNSGPGVGVLLPVSGFPRLPGLPPFTPAGMVPVSLSSPSTTKVAEDEAVKNAVFRKLREYYLNIDKSRLIIKTLSEADKATMGSYFYVVDYKLSESEKNILDRKSGFSPFMPMINFFPINSLPTGLIGIDGGIAYFITNSFDVIRNTVYLGDPRIIYPTSIVRYNPLYPIPYFSPYMYPQIIRTESTYRNPNEIFGERHTSRSPRSQSRSSSRSSSRSPSRSSQRSSRNKRQREKYMKYKQKYLELKEQLEN